MTNLKRIIIVSMVFVSAFLVTYASVEKVDAAVAINGEIEELRSVWVATVSNMNIAKQNGTSASAIENYKAKFIDIIDRAANYGMNAIFFQIRPCNDAFYPSKYNPWSRYLVADGVDAKWDPLAWMIDECHARGIEFHGWLNPYRASVSANDLTLKSPKKDIDAYKKSVGTSAKLTYGDIDNPIVKVDDPDFLENIVLGAEEKLVLNPAKQVTIDHIVKTIDEIITNYEIDGIHFDDYFYPSGGIETAQDAKDYSTYRASGGELEIADWRRNNVDRMVKAVSDLVNEYNATSGKNYVAFGISPAGVWAPKIAENCPDSGRGTEGGMNVSCTSYSSYLDLYADTRKWVEEEWIDYIAPQVYMQYGEAYRNIVSWWANIVSQTDVKLYIGTAAYRISEYEDRELISSQMAYVESLPITRKNVSGYAMFSYSSFLLNDDSTKYALRTVLYNKWKNGALAPIYQTVSDPGNVSADGYLYKTSKAYSLTFKEVAKANGYAIYRFEKDATIDFNNVNPVKVINQKTGSSVVNIAITNSNEYKYVIRTYNLNNQPLDDYDILLFDDIIENQAPTIELINWDNTKDYIRMGAGFEVKVKVVEDFDLPVTVTLYYAQDGTSFTSNYQMTDLGDGTYSYTWEPFRVTPLGAKFKIVASDTDKESELLTPEFRIIEQTADPDDTNEPADPDDNPGGSGSGGGTNCPGMAKISGTLVTAFASFALLTLIWRKRK